MKTKHLILVVLGALLWLAPELTIAQQRRVDWIHGLGGNADSWQNVNDTYMNQGRQIIQNSRWPYNTGVGIQNFANEITGRNLGGANTISISHSMGGTAVRQVDLGNANYWAGNITAGSPLRGGQIAVSVQNGDVQRFINNGIDELLRGPAVGTSVLTILSPGIGFLIQATGIFGSLFSNSIAGAIVNAITDSFGLTAPTAADLDPNGAYMQNIVNQGSNSPKIQVWGNEDQPIIWRVAGSYKSGSDQDGIDLMNTAAGLYRTAADVEYAMRFVMPFLWGYFGWRGDQWRAGIHWLQNTANQGWPAIIGAGHVQRQWVQVLEFTQACYDEMLWCSDPQNAGQCDDSQCMQWIWIEVDVFTIDQSDGVVPAFSARNDGGAWRGHIVEAPGTNHKELVQYNTAHNTYDRIFDGFETGQQNIFIIGR